MEQELKKIGEGIDGLKTSIDTVKTENAELKAEIKVIKDEAEKNQKALDELVVGQKQRTEKAQTFDDKIKDVIEKNIDTLQKGKKGDTIAFEIKAVGDITTSNVTGGAVWGANYRPGIVEAPKRKVHMRNVFAPQAIGAGTDYYFMKQNGNGEGSIAFTAESATKPQFDEDLVESSVKIETLAGWERISRKAMMNVPGLVSFLQSRMVEKLLKAEDAGILYGDGTSPNIKGILTAGNFTASASTSTTLAEKLIDDIAILEDTYERNATHILLRPQHYYGFFKNKAAGSGEYDLPQNVLIVNGVLYISGVPCYPTTALNVNTVPTPDTCDYAVLDASGVEFKVQEDVRIEFFYEDGTNVRDNKVTVRIEEVVALPVYGSDYVIKGSQNII